MDPELGEDDSATDSDVEEENPDAALAGNIDPDEIGLGQEPSIPMFTFGIDASENMSRILLLMQNSDDYKRVLNAYGLTNWSTAHTGTMEQGFAIGQVILESCHDALVHFLANALRLGACQMVYNLEKMPQVDTVALMRNVVISDPNFNQMQTPDLVCYGLNQHDDNEPIIVEITTGSLHIVDEKVIKYGVNQPNSRSMIVRIDRKETEQALLSFTHRDLPGLNYIQKKIDCIEIKEQLRLILIDFNVILERNGANYFDCNDVILKGNFSATIWERNNEEFLLLYSSTYDQQLLDSMGYNRTTGGSDIQRMDRAVKNLAVLQRLCGRKLHTMEGTLEDREHLEQCHELGTQVASNYVRFDNNVFPEEPMGEVDGLRVASHSEIPKKNLTIFPRFMDPFWDYGIAGGYAGNDMEAQRLQEIWGWLNDGNTNFVDTQFGTTIFTEVDRMISAGLKKSKIDYNNTVIVDRLGIGEKVRASERLGHFTYGTETLHKMEYPYHKEIAERCLLDAYTGEDTEDGLICELDMFNPTDALHPVTELSPDNLLSRKILEYTFKQCRGALADRERLAKQTCLHIVREHRGRNYESVHMSALDGYFSVYQDHPEVEAYIHENRGNRRCVDRKHLSTNLLRAKQFPTYSLNTIEGERIDLAKVYLQWGLIISRPCPQEHYETQPIRLIIVYRRRVTDPEFDANINLQGHLIDKIDMGDGYSLVAIQYKTNHYQLAAVSHLDNRFAGVCEQIEHIVYNSDVVKSVEQSNDSDTDSESDIYVSAESTSENEFFSAEDSDKSEINRLVKTHIQKEKNTPAKIKLKNGFIYPQEVTQAAIHNAVRSYLYDNDSRIPVVSNEEEGKPLNNPKGNDLLPPDAFIKSFRFGLNLISNGSSRSMEAVCLLKGLISTIEMADCPYRLGKDFLECCTISTILYSTRALLMDCWMLLEKKGIISLTNYIPNSNGVISKKIQDIGKEPKLIDAAINDKSGVLHPFLEECGIKTENIGPDLEGLIESTRRVFRDWKHVACPYECYPLSNIDKSNPSVAEIFRLREDVINKSKIEAKQYNGIEIVTKSGEYTQREDVTKRVR